MIGERNEMMMMPSATAFAHAEAGHFQTHGRRPALALVLKAGHFHRRKQEIGSERASAGVEGEVNADKGASRQVYIGIGRH